MPSRLDFSALPTNWALTLWDAVPIFIGIGGALAILFALTLPLAWKRRAWLFRRLVAIEGLAYILAFDPDAVPVFLGIIILATLFVALALRQNLQLPGSDLLRRIMNAADREPVPVSEKASLRQHISDLAGAIMISSAVAAVVNVLIAPNLEFGTVIWALIGIGAVLALRIPPGPSAIFAVAIATVSGNSSTAMFVIGAAIAAEAVRILMVDTSLAISEQSGPEPGSTTGVTYT